MVRPLPKRRPGSDLDVLDGSRNGPQYSRNVLEAGIGICTRSDKYIVYVRVGGAHPLRLIG